MCFCGGQRTIVGTDSLCPSHVGSGNELEPLGIFIRRVVPLASKLCFKYKNWVQHLRQAWPWRLGERTVGFLAVPWGVQQLLEEAKLLQLAQAGFEHRGLDVLSVSCQRLPQKQVSDSSLPPHTYLCQAGHPLLLSAPCSVGSPTVFWEPHCPLSRMWQWRSPFEPFLSYVMC